MGRSWVAVTLVALITVVGACGTGVDEAGPTGDRSSGERSGIDALLARVPDTDGASDYVVVDDLTAAAAAAGIEPPGPGASGADRMHYLTELSGTGEAPVGTAPAPLLRTAARDADWRHELGFAPVDLTGDVTSGVPPDQLQTFFGDFDPDNVDRAVEADPVWGDRLDTVTHDGRPYYSWGDDERVDPAATTTVRTLGESSRLFVDGETGVAYWAHSTATMEDALDTFAGTAPSLADDDLIGPMAVALDALGAYSAFLTTDVAEFRGTAVAGDNPVLLPYDAVATGAAVRDGEARLLVVLFNPDEGTAADNAERLAAVVTDGVSTVNQRPWSDALGAGEITVDGRLVTASFPTDDPRLWNGVVAARDSLLATG